MVESKPKCIECGERIIWYHGAYFCKNCAITFYNEQKGGLQTFSDESSTNTLDGDKNAIKTEFERLRNDKNRRSDE